MGGARHVLPDAHKETLYLKENNEQNEGVRGTKLNKGRRVQQSIMIRVINLLL